MLGGQGEMNSAVPQYYQTPYSPEGRGPGPVEVDHAAEPVPCPLLLSAGPPRHAVKRHPCVGRPSCQRSFGVPVHSQLESLDADGRLKVCLRFSVYERIGFYRHD